MRRIYIILVAIIALCSSVSAQNIRLGEKIPEISVESIHGEDLRNIEHEHTCIVFMHSQCQPCIAALPLFYQAAAPYGDRLAIVLLTNEPKEMEEVLAEKFGSFVTSIAFDKGAHTYRSFGINFVPFAVIYNTKSRRIEWFGSMQQLDDNVLNNICKQK